MPTHTHTPKPVDLFILPTLPKEVRDKALSATVEILTNPNRYNTGRTIGALPILERMQAEVSKHTQELYANKQEVGKDPDLSQCIAPLSAYIDLHLPDGICDLLNVNSLPKFLIYPIMKSWPYTAGSPFPVPATLDDLDMLVNAPAPESADYRQYVSTTLPHLHNQAYLAYSDSTIDNWDTFTFYGEARLNLLRYCLHNTIDILREASSTYPYLKDTYEESTHE